MKFTDKTVNRQGLYNVDEKGFYHTDGKALFYGNTPKVRELELGEDGRYEMQKGLATIRVSLAEVFPFGSGDNSQNEALKSQIDKLAKENELLKKENAEISLKLKTAIPVDPLSALSALTGGK